MSLEKSNLKWFVCGNVTPPKRNHRFDAGYDLFMPDFTDQFCKDLLEKNPGQPKKWSIVGPGGDGSDINEGYYIQLNPHQDLLIPMYVRARLDPEWALVAKNKSGVAAIQKLIVGAELIDPSYQGILHAHIINVSTTPQFISFGQKIIQITVERMDCEEGEIWYDESIERFKEYRNLTTFDKFYEGSISDRKEKGFSEGTGNIIKEL